MYCRVLVCRGTALLFHDVRVEDMAKYAFDAVTYHSHEVTSAPVSRRGPALMPYMQSALPLRTVVMESDMELRQAWPFVAKGG